MKGRVEETSFQTVIKGCDPLINSLCDRETQDHWCVIVADSVLSTSNILCIDPLRKKNTQPEKEEGFGLDKTTP